MAKKKLYSDMIPKIAEMLKLRMTWVQIAAALGVTDRTLQNWRNEGLEDRENGKRTNCRKLVDAIDQARTELIEAYASGIRNEILHGKKTITVKEIVHKDESITVETITRKDPPNTALGLKVLGMEAPEVWAENQNLNVNWQEHLASQGKDPEKIKGILKAYLKERASETSEETVDSDGDATADDTT